MYNYNVTLKLNSYLLHKVNKQIGIQQILTHNKNIKILLQTFNGSIF